MNLLMTDNISQQKKGKTNQIKDGHTSNLPYIKGEKSIDRNKSLNGNIENFIGYAQIPVGLAGPILIKGIHAQGSFSIPLATTEGALVASYSRGMKACRLAGGVKVACVKDLMIRAPYFKFDTLSEAMNFSQWAEAHFPAFKTSVENTSRFCKLIKIDCHQEGNAVTIFLSFKTGDASGQNMTTIATDAICRFILQNSAIQPIQWYIESNSSGDKKATRRALNQTRGKKIITEVIIPRDLVQKVLKSTPEKMCAYFLTSTLASITVGAIGNMGHIANGLTALYLACGQDVACAVESSIGILRMECTDNKDLYASLTLPSLVVGTVGGGTGLSTQSEGLKIMDCLGSGKAQKFAEICGATALAGELSIAAAIAEDHFTSAHKHLGRKK